MQTNIGCSLGASIESLEPDPMSDLGTLRIWDDPAIWAALSWYLDVAENRHPAKFRIAATLAAELDPA